MAGWQAALVMHCLAYLLRAGCQLPQPTVGKGTDHRRQQSSSSIPASRTRYGAKLGMVGGTWEGAGVAVQTKAGELWALEQPGT